MALKFNDVTPETAKNDAAAAKRRKESKGTFTPNPFYDLQLGENTLRLCPPWKKGGTYHREVQKHWLKPLKRTVMCTAGTFPDKNIPCAICEVLRELEADSHTVKDYRAGSKFYTNSIVRTDERWTKEDLAGQKIDQKLAKKLLGKPKVQIVSLPARVLDSIALLVNNPDVGNITHPLQGFDIIVRKDGKIKRGVLDTSTIRYSDAQVLPKMKPIFKDEADIEFVLLGLADLDKIWHEPKNNDVAEAKMVAKKLKRIILQSSPTEDEDDIDADDDDDVKDKKSTKKKGDKDWYDETDDDEPKSKKKPKDDEDEDDAEEDEDGDDDDAPKAKSKKDDAEEDEEDDEESEEFEHERDDVKQAIVLLNEAAGSSLVSLSKSDDAEALFKKLKAAESPNKKKFANLTTDNAKAVEILKSAGHAGASYVEIEADEDEEDD